MKTIIFLLTILIFFTCDAFAGNPAPYTEEAYRKIESITKDNLIEHDENLSKEERARKPVELMRSIFEQAGYDYDDTITKVVDDMRNHPERIPNNPESVPTMIYVGIHLMMSNCDYLQVDCLKFFPSDTAESIRWLLENTEFSF